MAKRKTSTERKLRREVEILKAQMKTKGRVTYQVETAAMPMPEVSKSTDRLKLPIKNIKNHQCTIEKKSDSINSILRKNLCQMFYSKNVFIYGSCLFV